MSITLEQFGIDRLDAAQRLELIELLWDSMPEDAPVSPPEWHLRELERRLETPLDPNEMETWESVHARLLSKS